MNDAQLSQREQLALSRKGDTVAPRLVASWRRSAGNGVSLDSVSPVFAGGGDDESMFYESGQSVLRGLQQALATSR